MKTDIKHLEKFYYRNEYPKVLKLLEEFKKEHPQELKDKTLPKLYELVEEYQFLINHCNEYIKNTDYPFLERRQMSVFKDKCDSRLKTVKAEIKKLESFVKGIEPEQPRITDLDKFEAKNYPISTLIEFNRQNKAQCIFHDDENPSMHYYESTNTVYCFSCQASGDAIDVFKKLHNCDFQEAVLRMVNKY